MAEVVEVVVVRAELDDAWVEAAFDEEDEAVDLARALLDQGVTDVSLTRELAPDEEQ